MHSGKVFPISSLKADPISKGGGNSEGSLEIEKILVKISVEVGEKVVYFVMMSPIDIFVSP